MSLFAKRSRWWRRVSRAFAVAVVAAATTVLLLRSAEGNDELYKYKLPCAPGDACWVTQLTHADGAFDFDPRGGGGLGEIRSVSEGTFEGYLADSFACSENGGLGRYAQVTDMHGRVLNYAHLSQVGLLVEDQRVLQGDIIGTEGDTGHTHWFDDDEVHHECAAHLHLSGISGAPGMDGISMSNIQLGADYGSSTTNSVVGALSNPGAGIRQKYIELGNVWTSWATVGWTADWTGSEAGCGAVPFCRLKVHFAPDAVVGRWGAAQVFRKHPGVELDDDGAIMVGRWALESPGAAASNTYWVQSPLFKAWVGAYQGAAVGVPIAAQEEGPSAHCPSFWSCVKYQRFHRGYIWEQAVYPAFVFHAVTCPDYDFDEYYNVRISDILLVVNAFGHDENGRPPDVDWNEGRVDSNSDGAIRINDITFVVGYYGLTCYPT